MRVGKLRCLSRKILSDRLLNRWRRDALLAPTRASAQSLDAAAIGTAVRAVADVFEREYFDAALSKTVAEEIKRRLDGGRYASANVPAALAKRLTADFYELTKDKHIAVALATPRAANSGGGGERRNVPTTAGFRRTEIIAGNIGVLDLAFFMRPDRASRRAGRGDADPAAGRRVDPRHARERRRLAGHGGAVHQLSDRRHGTAAVRDRSPRRIEGQSTAPRAGRRPVATRAGRFTCSRLPRTFSGGEGLAFLLQELKRAVVIGEVTAGAANPGRPYPAGELFEITVPNGSVVTAIGRAIGGPRRHAGRQGAGGRGVSGRASAGDRRCARDDRGTRPVAKSCGAFGRILSNR